LQTISTVVVKQAEETFLAAIPDELNQNNQGSATFMHNGKNIQ